MSFKPLMRLLVDMDMRVSQLHPLVGDPRGFFRGDIDYDGLNAICNYLGVPPHMVIELVPKDLS